MDGKNGLEDSVNIGEEINLKERQECSRSVETRGDLVRPSRVSQVPDLCLAIIPDWIKIFHKSRPVTEASHCSGFVSSIRLYRATKQQRVMISL
ncbi:hypothetical protein RRG08_049454 [Elysia crispata]|uniref:Uncharacterized protein n=1 Tax=Elysia crispata TaxID=231223 RepID=A0AAE0ZRZ7_9GAST|nr:hypothetical protein RRG08_049454 [Elysia crispata]